MNIKLQIIMTDTNGNKITENIGYVNPNVTDGKLNQLCRKLCALTTNTFIKANKVVTTDITEVDENG